MPYIGLGYRRVDAQPDKTRNVDENNNPRWTITCDPAALNVNVPYFEVYRVTVSNGAPQATFTMYVDIAQFEIPQRGDANSWDPNLPLLMIPGQTLYFYYDTLATDGFQPTAYLYLRFDPTITANANTSLGQ